MNDSTLSPGGVVRETPEAGAGMSPVPASPGLSLEEHRCRYPAPPVSRLRPPPGPKAKPVEVGTLEDRVLAQLRSRGGKQGYTELRRALKVGTDVMSETLARMLADGQVQRERVQGGWRWVAP